MCYVLIHVYIFVCMCTFCTCKLCLSVHVCMYRCIMYPCAINFYHVLVCDKRALTESYVFNTLLQVIPSERAMK